MSALFTMQDLLSPENLSAAYTKLASLSVQNPMLDYYQKPEQVDGQTIEVMVFDDSRQAAPINSRGAPAKTLDANGATKATYTPIHYFNEISIPEASVEFLRMADRPGLQDRGMQEIRRQMSLFARRHRALRAVVLAKALGAGAIYFDADGNVLESSSGARTTVDLGVAASHQSQLNHSSAGGNIIGTAWDNAGASILTDLEQIREAAEYDKAPRPKHVWMHSIAKPWILTNTELKQFVQYTNPQAAEHLRVFGGASDTLEIGDWTFHFYNGTYVGADGSTIRPLLDKTKAVITPDVNDGDWFRHFEASETIPTDEGVIGSFEEFFSKTKKVYGDFAYARIEDNPLKLTMRLGGNFFYAFSDPNAVWMPTVDF